VCAHSEKVIDELRGQLEKANAALIEQHQAQQIQRNQAQV
jgi:hypothetical protein